MKKKDMEETSVEEAEEESLDEENEDSLDSEESEETAESSEMPREEPQREMHPIKCSECGKDAEVPFKPIEGRPVYCRDCFMKHRKPRRSFGYNRRY
jgi:CxxC-x17-CxxC domain-containing protein